MADGRSEVQGEFIPLVDIDEAHLRLNAYAVEYEYPGSIHISEDSLAQRLNVVILHSADKKMGLKVNELQGGQDIVIFKVAGGEFHSHPRVVGG